MAGFSAPHTISKIILLTGQTEGEVLGPLLQSYNRECVVTVASDRPLLDSACQTLQTGTRLISFCSPVIVPAAYLAGIDCGSYNFHPGPPSYPGRYPSVFALYDGATEFGITVHNMAARVDEGPIVCTERFPVPLNCDLETLDTLAFQALIDLFRKLAMKLATDPRPLPLREIGWSGTKRSKADCDNLCLADANLPTDELRRRQRACGPHFKIKS